MLSKGLLAKGITLWKTYVKSLTTWATRSLSSALCARTRFSLTTWGPCYRTVPWVSHRRGYCDSVVWWTHWFYHGTR